MTVPPDFQREDSRMGNIVAWAMLTGGVIGGVWASIVLLVNQAGLRREQQALGAGIDQRREELARLEARLEFIESQFRQVDPRILPPRVSDVVQRDTGAVQPT